MAADAVSQAAWGHGLGDLWSSPSSDKTALIPSRVLWLWEDELEAFTVDDLHSWSVALSVCYEWHTQYLRMYVYGSSCERDGVVCDTLWAYVHVHVTYACIYHTLTHAPVHTRTHLYEFDVKPPICGLGILYDSQCIIWLVLWREDGHPQIRRVELLILVVEDVVDCRQRQERALSVVETSKYVYTQRTCSSCLSGSEGMPWSSSPQELSNWVC